MKRARAIELFKGDDEVQTPHGYSEEDEATIMNAGTMRAETTMKTSNLATTTTTQLAVTVLGPL